MSSAACAPSPVQHIYRRVLGALNANRGSKRLWPRWKWEGRTKVAGAGTGAGALEGLLTWPRWLTVSVLPSALVSSGDGPPSRGTKSVPSPNEKPAKRRPDLNSTIYTLMNHPALFDPVRTPRNKIVLCHGLYGFDVRGPSAFPRLQLHYWSTVLDILKGKLGADVVVTGVPGTGSIEDRASKLHHVLASRVAGEPINFIAHSMGGLDCRHLISRIQPKEYEPVSLTTVSTPHRGSSFMDWCAANIGIGELGEAVEDAAAKASARYVPPYSLNAPLLSRTARDETTKSILAQLATLPQSLTSLLLALIDSPAYANLTTAYLSTTFNPQTPDAPGVKYFSVGARASPSMSVFHPLWLPKTILDAAEHHHAGKTPEWGSEEGRDWRRYDGHDGLVSVASARWGEFLGVLEGVDHWELRGAGGLRSAPPSGTTSSGWTEWAKSFGLWKDAQALNQSRASDTSEEGQKRAAVTAALDWVVNTVSSSHAANPGAEHDPARDERRRRSEARKEGVPVFDLERFYVALCRRLYDEGL